MTTQRADARRGAARRRIRRLGRNAQREARHGKRGEDPCEALDDGDGIRNGAGAQREREEENDYGGGKTPPPGFAESPLREGAGATRRGIARLAPPPGELESEARRRGFLAPPASEERRRGPNKEQPAEETGGGRARRDSGRRGAMAPSGGGIDPRGERELGQSRDKARNVGARAGRGGRVLAAPGAGR